MNQNMKKAWVGFDGFTDRLTHVVADKDNNTCYPTISDFSGRIRAAAGISCDLELTDSRICPGGNAPIMAQAMGRLGIDVTLAAAVGEGKVSSAFQPWQTYCRMIPLGESADTLALEFNDGKIMLADLSALDSLTWEKVKACYPPKQILSDISGTDLIALTCWSLLPHGDALFCSFRDEILAHCGSENNNPVIFFDPADMSKHSKDSIRRYGSLVASFRSFGQVVLGLNLNEGLTMADAYDLKELDHTALFAALYQKNIADVILIHPRNGCYVCDRNGVRWLEGDLVERPIVSTGGGDHFNAGFCAGVLSGLPIDEAVRQGMHVSHYFVKTGNSPMPEDIR